MLQISGAKQIEKFDIYNVQSKSQIPINFLSLYVTDISSKANQKNWYP